MPYMENHTLYYKKQCPFCQKVLRFMDANKITMDTRDTVQPERPRSHRGKEAGSLPRHQRQTPLRIRRHHRLPALDERLAPLS